MYKRKDIIVLYVRPVLFYMKAKTQDIITDEKLLASQYKLQLMQTVCLYELCQAYGP